jgi:GTPase SAR1 family protein
VITADRDQLWDTAGTERFRSVSRSYYRGAAGAVLVYDIASHTSFSALPTFLNDARALASPQLSVLLVGNKLDLSSENTASASASLIDAPIPPPTPSSSSVSSKTSKMSQFPFTSGGSVGSTTGTGLGARNSATVSTDGREVSAEEASRWASSSNIPVSVEVSALSGDNVEDVFTRLAQVILTKIELGEIDPDDPQSGIQYGDSSAWGAAGAGDGASIKSGMTLDDGAGPRRRRGRGRAGTGGWLSGVREWEEVFKIQGVNRRNRGGCC